MSRSSYIQAWALWGWCQELWNRLDTVKPQSCLGEDWLGWWWGPASTALVAPSTAGFGQGHSGGMGGCWFQLAWSCWKNTSVLSKHP